jgi:hypothetical protein
MAGLAEKLAALVDSILNEKLILFNNGTKFNQAVLFAGGAGSGKGFALTNMVDASNFKVFDVDELKTQLIKLAKRKGSKGDKEIANLNLKNPKDVARLHQIVKDKGLFDKKLQTLFNQIDPNSKKKPNLLFDKTLADKEDITKTLETLKSLGYKPEDIHLVWVLTNYKVAFKNNITRDRIVPTKIFLQTHRGAKKTISDVMKDNVPKDLDGDIYVILNNKEETVNFKDAQGNDIVTDFGTKVVQDYTRLQVKKSGKPIKKDKEVEQTLLKWVKDNAPDLKKV